MAFFQFYTVVIEIRKVIVNEFTRYSKLSIKETPFFLSLNRELFDLRKICVLILKTGQPKKMSYVGEFAS